MHKGLSCQPSTFNNLKKMGEYFLVLSMALENHGFFTSTTSPRNLLSQKRSVLDKLRIPYFSENFQHWGFLDPYRSYPYKAYCA